MRRWLGTHDEPATFPNAKLLVHHREWGSARDIDPYQRDWYCPGGIADIPESKIVRFDGSIMLGEGVVLVHTPGHTEGNHSIVAHTAEGLWVTSKNGICVGAYAPHDSMVWGAANYAKAIGTEVITNGNTLESAVDQYASMVQKSSIAGWSMRGPRFPNVFPPRR